MTQKMAWQRTDANELSKSVWVVESSLDCFRFDGGPKIVFSILDTFLRRVTSVDLINTCNLPIISLYTGVSKCCRAGISSDQSRAKNSAETSSGLLSADNPGDAGGAFASEWSRTSDSVMSSRGMLDVIRRSVLELTSTSAGHHRQPSSPPAHTRNRSGRLHKRRQVACALSEVVRSK